MTTAPIFCDEGDGGFGWIAREPAWMARACHALAADGAVWLVDPVDFAGLDERVRSLGEPRAVLQLFVGHQRDCAAIAARLGVPLLVAPTEVPGSPFETIRIPGPPRWRETALWWPGRRTLIVGEAVGTVRYFRSPARALGVHPVLRIVRPPSVLLRVAPEHILCGHGRGLHDGAASALQDAVRYARRDLLGVLPRLLAARKHPSL